MVSSRQPVLPSIFTSDQHKPSIRYEESGWAEGEQPALVLWAGLPPTLPDPEVMQLDEEPTAEPDTPVDWRRTYLNFLLHEVVPTDQTKAQWLARCAKSFVFIEGELYTQSHTSILQHCIPIEQGNQLLKDIHGGVCGHHAAPRTLVGNAFRQGFYWPTAVADAERIVRTCEGC
jgi:hypothetical protein